MSATGLTPDQEAAMAEVQWRDSLQEIERTHRDGAEMFKRLRYGKWTQWRLDVTVRNYESLRIAAQEALAYALALEDLHQFVRSKR